MTTINQESKLDDFIRVYSGQISKEICQQIIANSEGYTWDMHQWQSYNTVVPSRDPEHEFLRSPLAKWDQLKVHEIFNYCITMYQSDMFKLGSAFGYNGISHPNLNKYITNSKMSPHVDHIHSVFSGTNKGIPILSLVAMLNDEYEGGEFVFWEDRVLKMAAGDIVIFPSNFLYKHHVNTVTSGTRYSIVSWIY